MTQPTYDPGPVPAYEETEERERVRARQIAAIHALADWYTRNPQVPMPQHVIAGSFTYRHNGPEHDRVLEVMDIAQTMGAQPEESWEEVKVRHNLLVQDGMAVVVRHSAQLEHASAHRYVP